MKKIVALTVTSVALASAAFATGSKAKSNEWLQGKWSLRAFYGFNSGDVKDDLDIDGIFGGGIEYALPNVGTSGYGGAFHVGAEYNTSTEGTGNVKMDNWGLYVGTTFPLGQASGMSALSALVNVGYYNTKLHADGFDDDKWGFGFDAGFRYSLSKVAIELFYRQRPEVDHVSNSAIVIGVNFPIGN